ncbi:meprin A subunit beta-like [Eucyclogobius newberryi]|uniref:meprin A subunit beta-like n=1 Tax=Eucyclogobius newberryi TaxID=166745 RepID=UPI003B5B9DCA
MEHPFLGMFIQLVSGKYDDELTWPVPDSQVTLQLLDQSPNIQSHMSYERSSTSNLRQVNATGKYRWGKPEDHGTSYIDENGQEVFFGPKNGIARFFSFQNMEYRHFLKGGSAVFNVFFEDVSPLIYIDELPCPPEGPNTYDEADKGPCSPKIHTTTHPPQSTDDKSR